MKESDDTLALDLQLSEPEGGNNAVVKTSQSVVSVMAA